MGQFEKIVVLIAFFLVTVILVVTFSSPEDGEQKLSMGTDREEIARDEGPGDLGERSADRASELLARETTEPGVNPRQRTGGPAEGPSAPAASGVQPSSSNIERETPETSTDHLGGLGLEGRSRSERSADLFLDDAFTARALERGELPAGAALVTLDGLTRTFDPSLMEYAWRRGDNWVEVAKRLYGKSDKSALLRQFNEGSSYRAPGEKILVPVFDLREGQAARAEAAAEETSDGEYSVERGNLYRVEDGDSLWVISKKVYGKGSQWERIYEANRDLLSSPDDVKPGMGLKIP